MTESIDLKRKTRRRRQLFIRAGVAVGAIVWSLQLRPISAGLVVAIVSVVCIFSGCAPLQNLRTADRLDNGYTIVLPGIEGESVFNADIARGLAAGGVETAVEVDDWTTGCLPLFLYHLQHHERSRREAERIAEKIVRYQDRYPGRPVNLIGHSGGGAVALLTLEALPADRTINRVILVAPAISRDYDLNLHLAKAEGGIWNFYSPYDVVFLEAGTSVFGTIDRKFGPSAGAFGFRVPDSAEPNETESKSNGADSGEPIVVESDLAQLYRTRLHQVRFERNMIADWNLGGHFGATTIPFSRRWYAPLLATTDAPISNRKSPDGSDEAGTRNLFADWSSPTPGHTQ